MGRIKRRSGVAAAMVCILGALALAAATPARAVTQDEAEAVAWDFTNMKWVSPVTYDPPQNHGLVFVQGTTYTGEAYYYGGDDGIPAFRNKLATGGVPRKNAGIDCSSFVSRCWKTSRHTTATIPQIAARIPWDALVKGDALNIPYDHVILYHYRASSGAYVVWEASGGANLVVHRAHPASYAWTFTPVRYGGLKVTTAGAPAPPSPPVAPPSTTGATSIRKVILVTVDSLNVRSGPSTGHAKIGLLGRGQRYVAHAKSGDWYQFWFAGGVGWCHKGYVSEIAGVGVATVTATSLSVRAGPGTGFTSLGSVKRDQKYVPSMSSGNWYRIDFDGRSGWVSGDYVRLGAP